MGWKRYRSGKRHLRRLRWLWQWRLLSDEIETRRRGGTGYRRERRHDWGRDRRGLDRWYFSDMDWLGRGLSRGLFWLLRRFFRGLGYGFWHRFLCWGF